jgi:hypothetical protein
MLTQKQVNWALGHDWAIGTNENGSLIVRSSEWNARTSEYSANEMTWIGSFAKLREWAGY